MKIVLVLVSAMFFAACGSDSPAPATGSKPPSNRTIEGAQARCANPIALEPQGATLFDVKGFGNQTETAYRLVELRYYFAGSVHRPAQAGKAEVRDAGAASVRWNRVASTGSKDDFKFAEECSAFSSSDYVFGARTTAALTLDNYDGRIFGELEARFSTSSEGSKATHLSIDEKATTREWSTTDGVFKAFRLGNGNVVIILTTQAKDAESSKLLVVQYTYSLQAQPPATLADFVDLFQHLEAPIYPNKALFPGTLAVNEAKLRFSSGINLRMLKAWIKTLQDLQSQVYPNAYLYPTQGVVKLAVDLIDQRASMSLVAEKIRYYQSLQEVAYPNAHLPGLNAISMAFSELGIPLKADGYVD